MTWGTFQAAANKSNKDVKSEMRQKYNDLLRVVTKIIGIDVSSDELHLAAHQIFNVFGPQVGLDSNQQINDSNRLFTFLL